MASTLPFVSAEEWQDILTELETTKDGYAPDIDALQRAVLVDLVKQHIGRERPRFPTMLRKMWSGGEVQAWIDAHWPVDVKEKMR